MAENRLEVVAAHDAEAHDEDHRIALGRDHDAVRDLARGRRVDHDRVVAAAHGVEQLLERERVEQRRRARVALAGGQDVGHVVMAGHDRQRQVGAVAQHLGEAVLADQVELVREAGSPEVGVDHQHAAPRAHERAAETDDGRGLPLAFARGGDGDDLSAADTVAGDDPGAHAHDVEGVREDAARGRGRVAHERDRGEHGVASALLDLVQVVDRAVELIAHPGQQHAGEQADEQAEHDVEREARRDRRAASGGGRGELHRRRLPPAVGERERDLLGQLRAAAAQRGDLVVQLRGGGG